MSRTCFHLVVLAAVAFCVSAVPAGASHVACGATLTSSTTLDSDVVCPADYQSYGLLIAADNVLLKMNGYALRAGAGGGGVGITSASPDADGLQGVRIKRGSVEGFLAGIEFGDIDDSTIFKVTVTTNALEDMDDSGIVLAGQRNQVLQSQANLLGESGQGIRMDGDDAYAWGNVVASAGSFAGHDGVVAVGDRPRLVYNRVACSPVGQVFVAGVSASGYRQYAVVNRNLTQDCPEGVVSQAAVAPNAGGARVALNHTAGGTIGIRVQDGTAKVSRNLAQDASDTGIYLASAGTFVRANAAYNNGIYGILGTQGTVDGGDNVASGNGDGSPEAQCVNVECGPGSPPAAPESWR
jgi:hypothetical protein